MRKMSYIAERMKKIESERIVGAQEAMELLSSVARGEMVEEVLLSTPVGVKRMEKNADINQRLKALEQLLKRYPLDNNASIDEARLQKMLAEIALIHERINQLRDAAEGTSDLVDDWIKAVTEDG
jgi:phage terminase small subunit